MRVLLVQSLTEFEQLPIFPLGLCYIASNLTCETNMFDMNTTNGPYNDLENKLKMVRPDVVGISLRNIKVANPGTHSSSFTPHEKAIMTIKTVMPNVTLIAGGAAFSLYAQEIMKRYPEIDFAIFGEGEFSFPELLNNLDRPEDVKGVYYRRDGEVVFTGHREWIPSDKAVPPKRNLLNMELYAQTPFSIGVQTKRGCILTCLHCSDRYLMGQKLRLRPPVEVVNEIEELVKDAGVQTFAFVDQVFNIPVDHAKEICLEIIKRDIPVKWIAWFNEKNINEEFLRIVKKAGCAYLSFSPDSASDKVLKKLKKNISARDLYQTYKLAKKVDMKVQYSFMINAPGESLFTLIETLIFIIKARLFLGNNFMPHSLLMTAPMRIYPHTEVSELSIEEGLIDRNTDLVESVFYNPAPLKYVVSIVGYLSRIFWGIRKMCKKVKP